MSNYIRGKKYWGEAQEALVLAWQYSGNTQADYTRIHNALRPQLNYMAELILNRYFMCPQNKQTDLKKDAINFLFLKLKEYQPDRSKSGSYNFCGMILKHYYLEALVLDRDKIKRAENMFDYVDNYPDKQPIDYGENLQIDFDAVISHFKTLRKKVDAEAEKINRNTYNYHSISNKYKNQHMMLDLAIEYVEKFHNLDGSCMADYIFLNSNSKLKKTTIIYYFRQLLGLNVSIGIQRRDSATVDNKYNYMQDDFTPIESRWHRRQQRKNKQEYSKYMYF